MPKQPDYIAYVVSEPKEGQDKGFWTPVGAVWNHRDGEGFDLIINEQLSVAGRIVCRPRGDQAETPARDNRQRRASGPAPRG